MTKLTERFFRKSHIANELMTYNGEEKVVIRKNRTTTTNINLQPLKGVAAPCHFSKDEMKSILAESTDEARKGIGTSHEDFKLEMA